MVEDPTIRRRPFPVIPEDHSIAQAADIRRPPPMQAREEEIGAQFQKNKSQAKPPPSGADSSQRANQELSKSSRRVVKSNKALMEFLKHHQDGRGLSTDALIATAAMMAEMPQRKAEKKKRLRELYFKWARQKSSVLIEKILKTFRPKKKSD